MVQESNDKDWDYNLGVGLARRGGTGKTSRRFNGWLIGGRKSARGRRSQGQIRDLRVFPTKTENREVGTCLGKKISLVFKLFLLTFDFCQPNSPTWVKNPSRKRFP